MRRFAFLLPLVLLGAKNKEKKTCPSDMVRVPKTDVCIDRYEWPNKKGTKPAVAMTAVQSMWDKKRGDNTHNAEALCKSVGKRLCGMEEWRDSCKGKKNADYPFGRKLPSRARTKPEDTPCNYAQFFRTPNYDKVFKRDQEELDRLNQSDKSGARTPCTSASGAQDMMGNVEEWVVCPDWMSKSKSNCTKRCADGSRRCAASQKVLDTCYCLAGRYWSAPVKCHEMIAGHAPQYHDYETGFRCCKDL